MAGQLNNITVQMMQRASLTEQGYDNSKKKRDHDSERITPQCTADFTREKLMTYLAKRNAQAKIVRKRNGLKLPWEE